MSEQFSILYKGHRINGIAMNRECEVFTPEGYTFVAKSVQSAKSLIGRKIEIKKQLTEEKATFTQREIGALIAAVGHIMHQQNHPASRVQDGSFDEYIKKVLEKTFDVAPERADALIRLRIADAVKMSNAKGFQ